MRHQPHLELLLRVIGLEVALLMQLVLLGVDIALPVLCLRSEANRLVVDIIKVMSD